MIIDKAKRQKVRGSEQHPNSRKSLSSILRAREKIIKNIKVESSLGFWNNHMGCSVEPPCEAVAEIQVRIPGRSSDYCSDLGVQKRGDHYAIHCLLSKWPHPWFHQEGVHG